MTFALSSPWLAWHLLATPVLSLVGQRDASYVADPCVSVSCVCIHVQSDTSVSGLIDMQIYLMHLETHKAPWGHSLSTLRSHGLVITIRDLT